ncbi:MAG: hypothetical protein HY351_01385 [Candidatus Omnitrophica bacterium]|nr:hypothetical protein [Candidatus Omnitrophota bacterium]
MDQMNGKPLMLAQESKIFVLCPSNYVTGGTEALHQLVSALREMGRNASIVYEPEAESSTPQAFACYGVHVSNHIEDREENLLVVPEIWTMKLQSYTRVQKAIWWLSVENYIHFDRSFDFSAAKNRSVFHFAQSKYAEEFLIGKGIGSVFRLSDYLNNTFFESDGHATRLDNILYNPKKGFEYTRILINSCPELNWIPIEKMSAGEVSKLMRSSKVYIDFGSHPGKDRLPREAAINGCCVIVGLRGAAKFEEDIPISSRYKFSTPSPFLFKVFQADRVLKTIGECLVDFEIRINDFKQYRSCIMNGKDEFQREVRNIYEIETMNHQRSEEQVVKS